MDLRVLEAQPLGRVVELEVDTQVVRVLLELVAGPEPSLLVDLEGQEGERRGDLESPVPVAVRRRAEIDEFIRGCPGSSVTGRGVVRGGLGGHLLI